MAKSIAIFIPSFDVGGVEKSLINLANALSRDYRVEIIVCVDKGAFKKLVYESVTIRSLGALRMRFAFSSLYKLIKTASYDVIISGPTFCNLLLLMAKFLSGSKMGVIVTQHNYQDIEIKGWGIKGKIIPFLIRRFYNFANEIVAVSEGVKLDLITNFNIKKDKVTRIYNPVITDDFFMLSNKESSLTPFKNDYILFIGRLEKVKNCRIVIEAFAELKKNKKYQHLDLVIIGDGHELEMLRELSTELKVSEAVHFSGAIENPLPVLKNASVLVNSSLSEAMGIVLVEALALGKPVVASSTMGACEVLENIPGSAIFPINDLKQLGLALEKFLNNTVPLKVSELELSKYTTETVRDSFITLIEKQNNNK